MARRAAKVDANQGELVKYLRSLGVGVEITSSAHDGFPDLVLGYEGVTVLAEVKDGDKAPSSRKLTPAQVDLHDRFMGAITVIESTEQAAQLFCKMQKAAKLLHGMDWSVGAHASKSPH